MPYSGKMMSLYVSMLIWLLVYLRWVGFIILGIIVYVRMDGRIFSMLGEVYYVFDGVELEIDLQTEEICALIP